MNKQELIKKIKEMPYKDGILIDTIEVNRGWLLRNIEELEPEKVTIPQFVAEYIEQMKNEDYHLIGAMTESRSHKNKKIDDCLYTDNNIELFPLAWMFGYEVEKEKRYLVKVKGINEFGCYLNKGLLSKEYFFESKAEIGGCRTKHTRKQLEDDDFGWVFDCEGIEIEEVEKELNNDQ